jgi:hypothetical protein
LTTFYSSLAVCVVNVSSGFGIQIVRNHLTGVNQGEELIYLFYEQCVCLALMQADGRQLGFGLPLVILRYVIWCLLVAGITGLEAVFL